MIRYSKLWIVFLVIILMNGCEKKAAEPAPFQTVISEAEIISTPEEIPPDPKPVDVLTLMKWFEELKMDIKELSLVKRLEELEVDIKELSLSEWLEELEYVIEERERVLEERKRILEKKQREVSNVPPHLRAENLRLEIEEIPAGSLPALLSDFLSEYFQNDDYVLWEPPLDVKYREIHIAVHYIMKFDFYGHYRAMFDKAIGFEITDVGIIPYLYVKDFQFIDKNGTVFIDLLGFKNIYGFFFTYSFDISGERPSGLGIDTYFNNGIEVADYFRIYWNEDDKVFEEKLEWWQE